MNGTAVAINMSTIPYPQSQLLLQGGPHPSYAEKSETQAQRTQPLGHTHKEFCRKDPCSSNIHKILLEICKCEQQEEKEYWPAPKETFWQIMFSSCHVFCEESQLFQAGKKNNNNKPLRSSVNPQFRGTGVYTTKFLPHSALTGLCRRMNNPSRLQSTFQDCFCSHPDLVNLYQSLATQTSLTSALDSGPVSSGSTIQKIFP